MFHLMKNKKFRLVSLFFFIIFLGPVKASKIVKPTEEFYVNDYANILSSETEKYIMDKSVALNKVDGTQIVVVTVPNLDGNSLEDYAYDLFKEFKIGDKEKDNGLLLLLALEERKFRVEVGNGLEGILPDGKTGRFQDQYIIPYLKDDKWDEGIKNGYDAFYTEIVKLNNLDLTYENPKDVKGEDDSAMLNGFFLIASIFLGIFAGNFIRKQKKNKELYTIIYVVAALLLVFLVSRLVVFNLLAFLITRFARVSSGRYYGGGNYYGGSSGFSGGSSGGGFSGGGGSSSGGGSSRGF